MKNLFLILFLLSGIYFLSASGTGEKRIEIYYSSSLNGNLDGCKCKSNPKAGLVKRALFLRDINKNRSVLLDTGDIFDVYEDQLLSDYIINNYTDLGYDGVALGDQEFSNGTDYLLSKITDGIFISNNLSIKNKEGVFITVSQEPLIINKENLVLAIISITDPGVFRFYPEEITENIGIENPESVISRLLSTPQVKNSDIKILLLHGTLKEARETASKFPSIDVVIAGHEQQTLNGEMEGNTILLSPGGEGNILGHLTIKNRNGNLSYTNEMIPFSYSESEDDQLIRADIEEYTETLKQRLKN